MHVALLTNLKKFELAIQACVRRSKSDNKDIAPWMAKTLDEFFKLYSHELHHHHDNEERVAFPAIQDRVTIPPGMRADHKIIIQTCDNITTAVRSLMAEKHDIDWQRTVLTSIAQLVENLTATLEEHFREEEEGMLVLLRHNFTPAEWKPIEKKILEGVKPISLAFLLDGISSDEKRAAWCQEVAGIPRPVINFVMMPAHRKFTKQYTWALQDVVEGQQTSVGCFGCVC